MLSANASDPDGTISKVEFFQGATKLGETNTAPYQFTWNNVPAGLYSLTARATDDSAAATVSSAAAIRITAPSLSASYSAGQIVISWSTAAGSYTLEMTDSLMPPVTWSPAPETPVVNGQQTTVTITAGADKVARVWTSALVWQGTHEGVAQAAFSGKGDHVVSGGADKAIKVWNAADGKEVKTIAAHEDVVAESTDQRVVAALAIDAVVADGAIEDIIPIAA